MIPRLISKLGLGLVLILITSISLPLLVEAADRPGVFKFTWQDTSNNEDGFKLYLKKGDGTYGLLFDKIPANAQAYDHSMIVSEGSRYCFALTAFNVGGESARSNDACATVPFLNPSVPSGFAVTVTVTVTTP